MERPQSKLKSGVQLQDLLDATRILVPRTSSSFQDMERAITRDRVMRILQISVPLLKAITFTDWFTNNILSTVQQSISEPPAAKNGVKEEEKLTSDGLRPDERFKQLKEQEARKRQPKEDEKKKVFMLRQVVLILNAVSTLQIVVLCRQIHMQWCLAPFDSEGILRATRRGALSGVPYSKPIYILRYMFITAGTSGVLVTVIYFIVIGVIDVNRSKDKGYETIEMMASVGRWNIFKVMKQISLSDYCSIIAVIMFAKQHLRDMRILPALSGAIIETRVMSSYAWGKFISCIAYLQQIDNIGLPGRTIKCFASCDNPQKVWFKQLKSKKLVKDSKKRTRKRKSSCCASGANSVISEGGSSGIDRFAVNGNGVNSGVKNDEREIRFAFSFSSPLPAPLSKVQSGIPDCKVMEEVYEMDAGIQSDNELFLKVSYYGIGLPGGTIKCFAPCDNPWKVLLSTHLSEIFENVFHWR
ncbi:hypothetical protein BUALT_Bualt02G0200600 [Buddleja alternifolia]|uniref:Uncharacterized protein n=1 Tax=Buddleja alternifolia TaxID=168488 RepID=A0AAV6Y8V3_9LAMI|nr:hypothetical protein BUALT_Bualt02G0200600 [Buddleja alternifolia]